MVCNTVGPPTCVRVFTLRNTCKERTSKENRLHAYKQVYNFQVTGKLKEAACSTIKITLGSEEPLQCKTVGTGWW